MDNTWAVGSDTDIRGVIIERFNIRLTWLDMKRIQYPLKPHERQFIDDNIASNEKFEPGWLNDEVGVTTATLVFFEKLFYITGTTHLLPGHSAFFRS